MGDRKTLIKLTGYLSATIKKVKIIERRNKLGKKQRKWMIKKSEMKGQEKVSSCGKKE